MPKRAVLVALYAGFALALGAGAGSAKLLGAAALVGLPAAVCFAGLSRPADR